MGGLGGLRVDGGPSWPAKRTLMGRGLAPQDLSSQWSLLVAADCARLDYSAKTVTRNNDN